MKTPNSNACSEYESLSRRGFLARTASLAALSAAPAWLPKVAYAQQFSSKRDVLISVYLRGGIDGLTLCSPYFEDRYYALRPNINVPRPDSGAARKGIALDDRFAIPPALSGLKDPYDAGWLLFVHAVGSPNWSRSHFDAQQWMEVGVRADASIQTGWLGRHLASVPSQDRRAILRGISMTYGMRQTLLGAPRVLPIPDPDNFGFAGWWENEGELSSIIAAAYERTTGSVKAAASSTRMTIDLLERIDFAGYQPAGGAVYPEAAFGASLRATAALMKAEVGVEAIHIDLDGWDTHSNQEPIDGYMNGLMQTLGDSMGAFWKDMFASNRGNWTMMVVSEFGRTATENMSKGTDHGFGNAMMVMGGAVNGKQVMTRWPGLQPEQLYEGVDLAATIDHRDILSEILVYRGENKKIASVFPGYKPVFRGAIRPYRR